MLQGRGLEGTTGTGRGGEEVVSSALRRQGRRGGRPPWEVRAWSQSPGQALFPSGGPPGRLPSAVAGTSEPVNPSFSTQEHSKQLMLMK